MGNFSTIFAAIFCATAPLASDMPAEVKTELAESKFKLGKETVKQVRNGYQNGEYKDFLSRMDSSYQEADVSGLIQLREKEVPVEFQDQWEAEFVSLQKEKNKDLLAAISDKDDSIFAEKVRSVAANLSTPEQEKGISKLHSLIAKAPHTGANQDENILIDIDVEYEYKLMQAQLPASDTSPEQMHAQQLALRMEKMDKMVVASKSFQDPALKQAVGLAAANLDARLARNLDGADLNGLVKAHTKASNETEEQVYSILSSYQGQFADLMKNLK